MTRIFVRRKKEINEEDSVPNNGNGQSTTQPDSQAQQTTQAQNNAQITDAAKQAEIAKLRADAVQLVSTYNTLRTQEETLKRKLAATNAKLLSLNATTITLPESYVGPGVPTLPEHRFKKRLFESRSNDSQVEEIVAIFLIAFQRVPDISKTPKRSEVLTYARNTKNFIFRSNWAKEITPKNHWDELSAMIREKFERSRENINLSPRELNAVMDNIKDLFKKSSTFSWIFGNETDNDTNKENL